VGGFNSELCKFQVIWKFQTQNPYVSQKVPVFIVRLDTTNSEAGPGQGKWYVKVDVMWHVVWVKFENLMVTCIYIVLGLG